ncbi:CAAX amino terminal protease self- immunity [Poriferisphaera corsica]|uniref:CAAX amino terminal protease self-immunity n=1 Tax=Poriferisphaera corsica TaxID=2528020 RepID=A0A517YPH5_9BACT|nr:CPBP family intramembrane glutamic endopeptidase [Poriferisphaera corsica]QDU32121.1 CAAX amino terminal protease self- immunity [Poriferisphaera corsica]
MSKTGRQAQGELGAMTSYWERSHWPLQALIFLLPLILLYELGTYLYVRAYNTQLPNLQAEVLLSKFLNLFGEASGVYLPGLILIIVLFCWHIVRRDPWKPEPKLYLLMYIESFLLTIPLLVFAAIFMREHAASVTSILQQATIPVETIQGDTLSIETNVAVSSAQSWQAGLLLSIGAGIYEELVYRLILIAIIHTILVDLISLPPYIGAIGAVLGSSLAFGYIHPEAISLGMLLFYTTAGIYFAVIYLARGFGIVVATHVLYDIIAVSSTFLYSLMSD